MRRPRLPAVPLRGGRLPEAPVEGARRLAAGIGLEQVWRMERLVDDVAEGVEENALLEAGLARRVAELEVSLVPVLEARQRWHAEHPVDPV